MFQNLNVFDIYIFVFFSRHKPVKTAENLKRKFTLLSVGCNIKLKTTEPIEANFLWILKCMESHTFFSEKNVL